MADPNQITAMIHFVGTKNKTIVGTDRAKTDNPVASVENENIKKTTTAEQSSVPSSDI